MVHHGVHDLDGAAIRLSVPRAFTQDISRYVFDQTAAGARTWDGTTYRSKHGDELENWAFFEPIAPEDQVTTLFAADDPDLAGALRLHKLTLS